MTESAKPFEIPGHWQWSTFREIGEWSGGGTPSKSDEGYWNGSIPWVSPKDMKRLVIGDSADHVTREAIEESSTKLIPAESVLFVTRSGILERTLPTAITTVEATINQDLKALSVSEEIDSRFILYYTRAVERSILRHCAKDGTTVASLESSRLYGFPVPIPPLEEQRRIVAKIEELLSNLDAGLDSLQAAESQLKRYRLSVLQAAVEGRVSAEWRRMNNPEPADQLLERILEKRRERWEEKYRWERYESEGKEPPSGWRERYSEPKPPADAGDLPALPPSWEWTSLDEVTWNDVDYRGKTPPYSDSGIPTISAGNIKNGRVSFESREKYVSEETYQEWLTRGEPAAGDFIVTTEAPVGATALFPNEGTYLLTRRVLACQTLEVENRFLQMCFQIGPTRRHLDRNSRGTTVPRILKKVLFRTPIPLPPIAEQRAILQEVERLDSIGSETQRTVVDEDSRALHLRQSILQQAFRGELH